MTEFKYELGATVTLESGESGIIMGRVQYLEAFDDYLIRYVAGDGRLVTGWWSASAFESDNHVAPEQPPEVVVTTSPTIPTADATDVETDVDGMPWNADVHAATRSKNADGRWKAMRGKTVQAKEAREAFMSAGGAVTPPPVEDKPAPIEVVEESNVAPAPVAMPTAAPAPALPTAQAVVDVPTVATVIDKLTSLMAAGKIGGNDLGEIYTSAGITDLAAPDVEMAANDQVRVNLMTRLNGIG